MRTKVCKYWVEADGTQTGFQEKSEADNFFDHCIASEQYENVSLYERFNNLLEKWERRGD